MEFSYNKYKFIHRGNITQNFKWKKILDVIDNSLKLSQQCIEARNWANRVLSIFGFNPRMHKSLFI